MAGWRVLLVAGDDWGAPVAGCGCILQGAT